MASRKNGSPPSGGGPIPDIVQPVGESDEERLYRVHNLGIGANGPVIERLYQLGLPFQFDREVVKNGEEAGATWIVIEPDWIDVASTGAKRYRYAVRDNGCGMTGDELVMYMNHISASAKEIGVAEGNYGMGAKVSLLPWNKYALLVISWTEGNPDGAMIQMSYVPPNKEKGETLGNYALIEQVWMDENGELQRAEWVRPPPEYREFALMDPDTAKTARSGTIFIACGNTGGEDTYVGPTGAADTKAHTKALNTRYFEVKKGTTVRCYEFASDKKVNWPAERITAASQGGQMRTVKGMKYHLDAWAKEKGTVSAPGAKIQWWLLKSYEESPDRANAHSYTEKRSLVGALYDNEVYNAKVGGEGRHRFIQFGIPFEPVYKDVVILVEPDRWTGPGTGKLTGAYPDSSRAKLWYKGTQDQELPWDLWAEAFKASKPKPIADLIAAVAGQTTRKPKNLYDVVKQWLPRMRSRLFRFNPKGDLLVKAQASPVRQFAHPSGTLSPVGGHHGGSHTAAVTLGGRKEKAVGGYEAPDGEAATAKPGTSGVPRITWLAKTPGPAEVQRSAGDGLEDKAGEYDLAENHLMLNADFFLFRQSIEYWVTMFAGEIDIEKMAKQFVREVYERVLTLKLVHLRAIAGGLTWDKKALEAATTKESITAMVLGLELEDQRILQLLSGYYNKGPMKVLATKKLGQAHA
jgi:hypothetical protein